MTDQQKNIIEAFQYSYANYDDAGKLNEVLEALEKANRGEYLPHTIKTILIEVGFLNRKPQEITEAGLKYLRENKTNTMEKPKSITWKELKEFVNSIPEDQLNDGAYIQIADDYNVRPLNEPFFTVNDIYCNKEDNEDCGTLEDLQDLHRDEFNIESYELVTKEGTPFLWAD